MPMTPKQMYSINVSITPPKNTSTPINEPTNLGTTYTHYSRIITSPENDKWEKLEGRRIVDITHIFKSMQSIYHKGFDCTFRDLEFLSEIRKGYLSIFQFKCKICGLKQNISSENENNECNNININIAIVSATVNTGQGYSQLEEFAATLNMPNMCNRTYQDHHDNISLHMNSIALQEMQLAGKEEKRLAIENGDVDSKGRPKIAVIADGAWSKRSYKTNYNALSGVVRINQHNI